MASSAGEIYASSAEQSRETAEFRFAPVRSLDPDVVLIHDIPDEVSDASLQGDDVSLATPQFEPTQLLTGKFYAPF